MEKPILTYFATPTGRGLAIRLALWYKGVDFEDRRLHASEWLALKPTSPFGGLPILEIEGKTLAHSNAILSFLAEKYQIGPKAMETVEEIAMRSYPLRNLVTDEEKQVARDKFMETGGAVWYLLRGLTNIKKTECPEGPFLIAPDELTVADFKIYGLMRRWQDPEYGWIPPEFLAENCGELMALYNAIDELPFVAEYWKKYH